MVGGGSIAVTPTPWVHQWAETARIARGIGISLPKRCQVCVHTLSASTFSGVPWPRKTEGIRCIPAAPFFVPASYPAVEGQTCPSASELLPVPAAGLQPRVLRFLLGGGSGEMGVTTQKSDHCTTGAYA